MATYTLVAWVEPRQGRFVTIAAAVPADVETAASEAVIHEQILDTERQALDNVLSVAAELFRTLLLRGDSVDGFRTRAHAPNELQTILRARLVSRCDA